MVLNRWASILMSTITILICQFGVLRWTSTKESMLEITKENMGMIFYSIIADIFIIIFIKYVFFAYQYDLFVAIN